MNILITGAAGYLGSALWAYLRDKGYDVWGLDNFSGSTPPVVDDSRFIKCDVMSQEAVKLVEATDPEVVVHMAAMSNPALSEQFPHQAWTNNIGGLTAVMCWPGAETRRLIFSSTGGVYDQNFATEDGFKEHSPVGPVSMYSKTKLAGEWRIEADKMYRTAVIFRYFVVAGAYKDKSGKWWGQRRPNDNHLFPTIMDVATGQKPELFINGTDHPTPDGSPVRDFVHVNDLIEVHERAILGLFSDRIERFNIGTGLGYSVREIIKSAEQVTGKKLPTKVGPCRAGDPHTLVGNTEWMKTRLGWEPKLGLKDMLRDEWSYRTA